MIEQFTTDGTNIYDNRDDNVTGLDVILRVEGEFLTPTQQLRYLEAICEILNANTSNLPKL